MCGVPAVTTHSRGTIGARPYWSASTTVARTQPDVLAPHTTSVSHPASIDASGVPKNADANAFDAPARPAAASRPSTSIQRDPGRSTASAGTLRRKTAAARSFASS